MIDICLLLGHSYRDMAPSNRATRGRRVLALWIWPHRSRQHAMLWYVSARSACGAPASASFSRNVCKGKLAYVSYQPRSQDSFIYSFKAFCPTHATHLVPKRLIYLESRITIEHRTGRKDALAVLTNDRIRAYLGECGVVQTASDGVTLHCCQMIQKRRHSPWFSGRAQTPW